MSIVTVRWSIRADGHQEGDLQTVELTDYVQALVNQGRVVVIEKHEPVVGVVVAALDADTASPVPVEVDLPEPGAEGLLVPAKPKSRLPKTYK